MVVSENRKGKRSFDFALDILHIVIGILIVIFAVLAFLNPEENRILFPAIFLLAGILNFANGYNRFVKNRGRKKRRAVGAGLMTTGTVLFLLCVLSTLTIWWG